MSQNNGNGPRRPLTAEQKRRILEKRRRQRMKKRLMIIVPAAVLLVALIVVLVVVGGKDAQKPAADNVVEVVDIVEVSAEPTASPTPAPTATPEPVTDFDYDAAYISAALGEQDGPVISPDFSKVDPAKLDRWPETDANMMPVIYKAETTENIIAVTVDDCFQASNLRQIVQCALDNNAKLTIFPIGANLENQPVADVIKWSYENGMEIENHTYNHEGLFHYDDERMTSEIWYQNQKVNQVLGVDYKMHFFRPRGGDERNDQRVHAYINQLGYNAVAIWTKDGSNSSVDTMMNNLAPGNIYLFHTTNNDLNLLLEFIPKAVQAGYRLVTMNEMFGLPENETSTLTAVGEKPLFQPFKIEPYRLKKTSYVRAAAIVQKRLIELGWMEGNADGVFGNSSFMGTGFFQMASGIKPTGVADAETQKALFSADAAKGSPAKIAELKKQLGK